MSLKANFSQPPTSAQNALLYRRGQQAMELVEQCRARMEALNDGPADLNKRPDTVVINEFQKGPAIAYQPAGYQQALQLPKIRGEMKQTSMSAELKTEAREDSCDPALHCRVDYSETPQEKIYEVHNIGGFGSQTGTNQGTIRVSQTKGEQGFTVEQEHDFVGYFDQVAGASTGQATCAAAGPETAADAPVFLIGMTAKERIDTQISLLKSLDNGPKDLSPEPGRVIVADFARADSDNVLRPAGWDPWSQSPKWLSDSHYSVPLEGELKFDPATGAVQSFKAGLNGNTIWSLERDGAVTRYRQERSQNEPGGFTQIDMEADGSMKIETFATHRQADLDKLKPAPAPRKKWWQF